MVCGGQECGGWHICRRLPDDKAPHSMVRASPWRNSEGRESAGSTTDPSASAWRWRHPAATGAPFTTWKPSHASGRSTGGGGCAGAALNLTPDTAPAPSVGRGRPGGKDASANPALRLEYRTTRFVAGYCDHGNAARAAREAGLGEGSGARRKG